MQKNIKDCSRNLLCLFGFSFGLLIIDREVEEERGEEQFGNEHSAGARNELILIWNKRETHSYAFKCHRN